MIAARAYGGGLSWFEAAPMFDAWYLKLAQTWDRLTTSEAAKAPETRYQAVAAKMASDVFAKAQRKRTTSSIRSAISSRGERRSAALVEWRALAA
jgi:hypothetical protein